MLIKWADTAEHTVHLFDAIADVATWNPMKGLHQFFGWTLKIQNRAESNRHKSLLSRYKDEQRAFAKQ